MDNDDKTIFTIKPYIKKAHFYETDQMGIIHHSNYIRWFEEARADFMEQIGHGYKKIAEKGIDFPILDVSCEYKSMVRFGDCVQINMSISELKNSRMTVNYVITDADTGELRTTGKTQHCFYNNIKMKPVSLKKELPEVYEVFDSLCS